VPALRSVFLSFSFFNVMSLCFAIAYYYGLVFTSGLTEVFRESCVVRLTIQFVKFMNWKLMAIWVYLLWLERCRLSVILSIVTLFFKRKVSGAKPPIFLYRFGIPYPRHSCRWCVYREWILRAYRRNIEAQSHRVLAG